MGKIKNENFSYSDDSRSSSEDDPRNFMLEMGASL